MKQYFCMNCMHPYSEGETACPSCGNIHGQEVQHPQALPCGTILNGRYLVGKAQKQDTVCMIYAGMDLSGPAPVTIREFLPQGQASRTDGAIRWSIPPQEIKTMCQGFHASVSASAADAFVANKTVYVITAAETVPEAPPAPEAAPASKPRFGKKTAIMAAGAAAAVLVLIGSWCGFNHLSGSRQMQNGAYTAAASAYHRDFLFGRSAYHEAIRAAAQEAWDAGDFNTAAELSQNLGKDAQELWEDILVEQLGRAYATDRSEDVQSLLEQIKDADRIPVLQDRGHLRAAELLLTEGKAQEAIDFAGEILDPANADPSALLAEAYPLLAEQCMDNGDLAGAVEAFQAVSDSSSAQKALEILAAAEAEDYVSAVERMTAAAQDGSTDLTEERWTQCLDSLMAQTSAPDLNAALNRSAAKSLLHGTESFTAEAFQQLFEVSPMISKSTFDPEQEISFSSRDTLFAQCRGSDSGKILVLVETHDFSTKAIHLMPSLAATALLPQEFQPASLSEVSHILIVSYDYIQTGSYTKGTKACRETGTILHFVTPNTVNISGGALEYGPMAPNTMTYSGALPDWYSGGAPNMGKALFDALNKLVTGK